MGQLRWRDVQALSDFLVALYELRTRAALIDHLLSNLPALVSSDSVSYNEIVTKRGRTRHHGVWAPKEATSDKLVSVFARHIGDHPVIRNFQTRADGQAKRWSDFLTQRQLEKTTLYNEYYRVLGIDRQIATAPSLSSSELIALAFNRQGRDYAERDRLVLNLLNPHLKQAFRNADTVTRWTIEQQGLSDLIDRLAGGVLEISRTGKIVWTTPQARHLLERVWGSGWHRRDLAPEPLWQWVRSRVAACGKLEQTAALLEPLTVPMPDGRLLIRLIRRDGQYVLFLDLQSDHLDTTQFEQWRLTKRQAEILGWIAQGKSNVEIGLIVGTSARTVQKHLERIFIKLGVENRTAAAMWALEQLRAGRVGH